jgi:hypothetical protein
MCNRVLIFAAVGFALSVPGPARADDVKEALVVKPGLQSITVWEWDRASNNQQTYPMTFDAPISFTADGRALLLDDLKRDMRVRLTLQTRGEVIWCAAIAVLPDDPLPPFEGWVVRAGSGVLVMKDRSLKNTYTYPVAPDAKILLEGREFVLDTLPPDALVQVTPARRGPKWLVVRIEVKDENRR